MHINKIILFSSVSPVGSVALLISHNIAFIGDTVEVTCTGEGGPGNVFMITKPEQNNTFMGGNTSQLNITINSAMDGGIFACSVSNLAATSTVMLSINGKRIIIGCYGGRNHYSLNCSGSYY